MHSRRRIALILALALVALLVPAGPSRAADPYEIDVIIPLTGPAGLGGQTAAKTLGAIEELTNRTGGIRGRPVHFVIHDDATNPGTAVQLITQVLTKKPTVVLGPMIGATCQAVAPIVKNGPVQYCFSPVVYPPPGSFTFTASPATQTYATAFFRYFRSRGIKSFALITSTDATGADFDTQVDRQLAAPEFKDSGLLLVVREHFNVADLSVAAQMARMKAANPQAIIAYANGAPFGTLLHGVQEAGLNIPVFGTSSAMVLALLKQLNDILPKELYFPGFPALVGMTRSKKEKAVQERAVAAEKLAGITPDALSLAPWDPATIVIDALRALGPDATADQLRAHLANLHGYVGLYGEYDFRDGSQRGLSADNVIVQRYDASKPGFVAVTDFGGRPLKSARDAR